MNKFVMAAAAVLVLATTPALADVECTYPKTCKSVLNAGYSSGGETEVLHIVGLTCLGQDGNTVLYQSVITGGLGDLAAAVTRMNRTWNVPARISFKPGDGDQKVMKCGKSTAD